MAGFFFWGWEERGEGEVVRYELTGSFGVLVIVGFGGLDFLMCDDDVNCECNLKLVESLILYRVHSCMV